MKTRKKPWTRSWPPGTTSTEDENLPACFLRPAITRLASPRQRRTSGSSSRSAGGGSGVAGHELRLTQHQNTSGVKMVYREGEGKDMGGIRPLCHRAVARRERSVLWAVLCDAYDEEVVGQDKKGNDDVRVVLHFHLHSPPFKAAILPLSRKDVLAGPAMELYKRAFKGIHGRLRRDRLDRQALPPRGRDRHAVLHHVLSTPSATRLTASRPTTASPSATATAWSRSVSHRSGQGLPARKVRVLKSFPQNSKKDSSFRELCPCSNSFGSAKFQGFINIKDVLSPCPVLVNYRL